MKTSRRTRSTSSSPTLKTCWDVPLTRLAACRRPTRNRANSPPVETAWSQSHLRRRPARQSCPIPGTARCSRRARSPAARARKLFRSSGIGMGFSALTFAPPVLPSGIQIRENSAAATMRLSCPDLSPITSQPADLQHCDMGADVYAECYAARECARVRSGRKAAVRLSVLKAERTALGEFRVGKPSSSRDSSRRFLKATSQLETPPQPAVSASKRIADHRYGRQTHRQRCDQGTQAASPSAGYSTPAAIGIPSAL